MMNENALISIVVPIYGTEAYLPKCIDSILGQTYRNLEIILVDDESPDRCPAICDAYCEKDRRIIVVHQENKGVSGARNTGLQRASGEYVMFTDSDDELYPDAVKLLTEDAGKFDADIVSGIKEVISGDGSSHKACNDGKCSVYRSEEPILLSLDGDKNTNSACAKLFRRDFIEGLFFEEGKNINEDGFFLFQCFLRRPVLVQHDTVVYRYNYRENSNSKQLFSEKYFSMLYFCEQKKRMISEMYPQYMERAYNMEVRTNLLFLDLLCCTVDKKYKETQSNCQITVRRLYRYHHPISKHHRQLALIVRYGFYPIYKSFVRLKHYH